VARNLVGNEFDTAVRLLAFQRLDDISSRHEGPVPRDELIANFTTPAGDTQLMVQQGIHKPRFLDAALSFTTAPEKPGRRPKYRDEITAEGYLKYRYQGKNANAYDNVAMRRAMELRVPLTWFFGVLPGWYVPIRPVFIVGDDPSDLAFTVAVDDKEARIRPAGERDDVVELRRAYITRQVLQRLHQTAFRERVLEAYGTRCAMCRLRHAQLLEAAHIIPDSDERGIPEVPNGLALCKLHHAAFDGHILGVTVDYKIELRLAFLEEIDGPMLTHGLQALHQQTLVAPARAADKPRREYLEERYAMFKRAG
jgi:putative restriction endonuclease